MSRLPYIETAYRDFLAERGPLHETMLEERRRYDEGDGRLWLPRSEWPEEVPTQVGVPGTIAYNLYAQLQRVPPGRAKVEADREDDPRMGKALRNWGDFGGADLGEYHQHVFYSSYRNTRHTYHVAEALWSEMKETEWPGETPAEALEYLPLPAFGLVAPDDTVYTICYDLRTQKEKTGQLELRIGQLRKDGRIKSLLPLHLTGSLDRAVEEAITQSRREARQAGFEGPEKKFGEAIKGRYQPLVNVLLYLAGEEDVRERSRDYPGTAKRHERGTKETEFEEEVEKEPVEADVGVRFQQAFERHEDEEKRSSDEGESSGEASGKESAGGSVRPHIRRPHPHLYWTGEGREIPRVKYLGPIGVNLNEDEEEDAGIPPTEQDVR